MKKILILFLACLLCGCATYKFQKPDAASLGYLAYYDGKPLAEYTVGKDKSLPDLDLAKERFKRRRLTVEKYYKRTGQIQTRFKDFFWDPPVMLVGFIGGVFRWPYTAISDYKYNHNPAYKAKADKLDEQREALEVANQNSLKKDLDAYIARDLAEESGGPGVIEKTLEESELAPQAPEEAPEEEVKTEIPPALVTPAAVTVEPSLETAADENAPVALVPAAIEPAVVKAPAVKATVKPTPKPKAKPTPKPKAPKPALVKKVFPPPKAVITAKPVKGYSPLVVKFSAARSIAPAGRIVAYSWDFGDGDTSTKKNAQNTYWSTTYGSRFYSVTLTVRDQEGAVSSATSSIEVITH